MRAPKAQTNEKTENKCRNMSNGISRLHTRTYLRACNSTWKPTQMHVVDLMLPLFNIHGLSTLFTVQSERPNAARATEEEKKRARTTHFSHLSRRRKRAASSIRGKTRKHFDAIGSRHRTTARDRVKEITDDCKCIEKHYSSGEIDGERQRFHVMANKNRWRRLQ